MIEALADPEIGSEEAPFEYLCCRQWNACTIRVSTANGLLAVARSPDILGFYDLETNEKSTIKLPHLPFSQMIVSQQTSRSINRSSIYRIQSFLPSKSCVMGQH